MKSAASIMAVSAFAVLVFAAVIYVQVGVWQECRSEGRSFFYCVNLIRGR